MQSVDQIITPRWLIPVDEARSVLEGHALAVADDCIVALDTADAINARYRAKAEIVLDDHALLPGLVNAHTHAAMTLLRGYADDLPLMEWLTEHIWPAERAWVDAGFVEIGTDLALAEMIRSGTTCFNDMYFFPEVAAARAENAGMRACIGMIVIDDLPSAWAQNADECINKGLELRDSVRHSALVSTAFAPHAPYSVGDKTLEKIRVLADELDCRIHMHIHETRREIEESTGRYGMRPLERLDQLDLVGPRLTAIHMIQLLPWDICRAPAGALQISKPWPSMASMSCTARNPTLNWAAACAPWKNCWKAGSPWPSAPTALPATMTSTCSAKCRPLRYWPKESAKTRRPCRPTPPWKPPPSAAPAPSGWNTSSAPSAPAKKPISSPSPSQTAPPSRSITP